MLQILYHLAMEVAYFRSSSEPQNSMTMMVQVEDSRQNSSPTRSINRKCMSVCMGFLSVDCFEAVYLHPGTIVLELLTARFQLPKDPKAMKFVVIIRGHIQTRHALELVQQFLIGHIDAFKFQVVVFPFFERGQFRDQCSRARIST